MSRRFFWGLIAPLGITVLVVIFAVSFFENPSLVWGVMTGLAVALVQSLISIGTLSWAWNKKSFYWVWGAGILVRLLIFAGTALVVYQYTNLNLVATLLTMITATTLFLVVESATFLGKKA